MNRFIKICICIILGFICLYLLVLFLSFVYMAFFMVK